MEVLSKKDDYCTYNSTCLKLYIYIYTYIKAINTLTSGISDL